MIDPTLINSLNRHGIELPEKTIAPNCFLRWGKNSRYFAKEFEDGSGWIFGDWSQDIREFCFKENNKTLSAGEILKRKKTIEQEKANAEKEREKQYKQAASIARNLWRKAMPATAKHPYLQGKNVISFGLKQRKNSLLVPLYDSNKQLSSIQFIDKHGKKRFLIGGKIKSCYFPIGKPKDKIYICEGYATGATIHKATNDAVAVAFNAGNLKPVAKAIRQKFPALNIVIAADNDQWVDGNPGITKATEAAKLINAELLIPRFKDTTSKPTDFNDLELLEGQDEVHQQLTIKKNTNESLDETINRLSKLTANEYEQTRIEEAKKSNIRVSYLDQQINRNKTEQHYSDNELESEIEPWSEEVSGHEIALEIKSLFTNNIVLTEVQATALTLWTIGTYCINAFRISPKLLINSPEKRCGKTTLMQILYCLVHKGLLSSNITSAAIFRSVELWQPTLLIDEGDTFIKNSDELRGIINSGHSRDSAYVLRVEGDSNNRIPKRYSTWAPMAIAMIKLPPDTILDRSIVVKLRRKLASENVGKLDIDSYEKLKILRQKLKRWANDNFDKLKNNKISAPCINNDRASDNWSPLLSIANTLNHDWSNKINIAIKQLTFVDDEETIAIMLLHDINHIFNERGISKIHSETLIGDLNKLEEHPWCEFKNGKPLTQNNLAKLLRPFGIKSHQLRIDIINRNGYEIEQFSETFSRYLPSSPTPQFQNSTTLQTRAGKGFSGFQNSTKPSSVEFPNSVHPISSKACRVVEFQKGVATENIERSNQLEVISI